MMFKKVKTCFSFKKTVYYETRNAEMQLSATYNGVMSISSNAREIEERVLNSEMSTTISYDCVNFQLKRRDFVPVIHFKGI